MGIPQSEPTEGAVEGTLLNHTRTGKIKTGPLTRLFLLCSLRSGRGSVFGAAYLWRATPAVVSVASVL